MGHLIALNLYNAGYEPVLWRGPNNSFAGKTWEIVSDMNEFVRDSKCVVFGGGMVFGDSGFEAYWRAISDLVDVCEAMKVPIFAISVGSNGSHERMNPAAHKLIMSSMFKAASLRLECDVDWLCSQGKQAEYIPDIVLTTLQYKRRKQIKKAAFCIKIRPWERPLLDWVVARLHARGIDVNTIGQFPDDLPVAGIFYHGKGTRIVNTGPESVVEVVRQADVVIGTGLHVGMAALSGGAEFISYRGEGKTVAFMRQCDRSKQVIGVKSKFGKPFCFYRLYRKICCLQRLDNDTKFTEMKKESERHYHFLHQMIREYSA
jgi:hypothetical protein